MKTVTEILNGFLKNLNHNEWLNLIFLILAIISIIISLYLYLKGKKEKEPTYTLKSFNLFKKNQNSLKDLTINYKGINVERLTITNISFWNKGKSTIEKNDIVEKDPIRIEFMKEIQILGTEIIFEKNQINSFSLDYDNSSNSIIIKFDFLDKDQGLKFRIYHNGLPTDKIHLKGTIKGVRKIRNAEYSAEYYADLLFDNTIGLPRKKMNNTFWIIYIILLFPIAIIIYLCGSLSAGIKSIFNRVPSDFVSKFDSINENN